MSTDINDVGTHNYSKPARAVIFGRAFSLNEVQTLQKACEGSSRNPVAWVAGHPAKELGPNAPLPGPGYAEVTANTAKDVLTKWIEEGAAKNEIVLY